MKLPEAIPEWLEFAGGLDQITPSIKIRQGLLRYASNVECDVNGGYTTVTGYERFDGRPAPSAATYSIIPVTITGAVAVNDTITGVTSAATAVVVANVTTYLVVTKVVGTFVAETLNVGGSPQATSSAGATVGSASTIKLDAQYLNLAADEYRDDIAAVTGSGNILGVWRLNNVVYAWRNNVGGTATAIYKSTASGWSLVALGWELAFTSGGVTEITEGQTITGAISGATAVLTRVMLESGTWAGGDAAGKFIFASKTGNFQAENIDVGASPNLATIAGNATAITLLPGGRYEFVNHNFGGQAGTKRIYGVDGVNRGFEFDGTVFCPIKTGMTSDIPTHVAVFKNHLFFSFAASAQHSGTGFPYKWTLLSGASELSVGDTITAFHVEPGAAAEAALGIYAKNVIHMLYGTSSSNWNLVRYRQEVGAFAHTVQSLTGTYFLHDQGVVDFQTVQAYGNFAHVAITDAIRTWLGERKTLAVDSCVVRTKSQYRLFFSDDQALYITFSGGKPVGMTPILLGHTVTCMYSMEANDGSEVIMFGSDDGKVYQMEKGTSFDGGAITWHSITHFNYLRRPRINKTFQDCFLEVKGDGYAEFSFSHELGFGDTSIPQGGVSQQVLSLSEARWDTGTWDVGFWDAKTLTPSIFNLGGMADNISLLLSGSSDYYAPLRFSGALVNIIPRGRIRA